MALFSSLRPHTRVSQLDSAVLDQEMFDLLSNQLMAVFVQFNKSALSKYVEEIKLVLKSLIFKFTLWDNFNTYGFLLQNLSLVDNKTKQVISKRTKLLYYLFFVLGDYLFEKLSSYVFSIEDYDLEDELQELQAELREDPTKRNYEQYKKLIKAYMLKLLKPIIINTINYLKVLKLLNFVRFLIDGKFNSLKFYVLNIRTKIRSFELETLNKGNVNYEFQNRQIVWNTLIEFVVFLLPIIMKLKFWQARKNKSFKLLRRKYWYHSKFITFWKDYFNGKYFSNHYHRLTDENGGQKSDEDPSQDKQKAASSSANHGPYHWLPESQCAVCYERQVTRLRNSGNSNEAVSRKGNLIVNPYVTNCGHIYSYLCILEKLERYSSASNIDDLVRLNSELKHKQQPEDIQSNSLPDDGDEDDDHWKCLRCNQPVLWCEPYNDIDPSAIVVPIEGNAIDSNEKALYDGSPTEESYQNIIESQLASHFLDAEIRDQTRIDRESVSNASFQQHKSDSNSLSYQNIEEEDVQSISSSRAASNSNKKLASDDYNLRNASDNKQHDDDDADNSRNDEYYDDDDDDEFFDQGEDYDDANGFDESLEL